MQERRQYIRISTVLPVEFFTVDRDGKRITPWLQGFTRDIGRGGICLVVNDLWQGFWDKFNTPGATLSLKINFPFGKAIFVTAKPSWQVRETKGDFTQYKIGLEFINARPRETGILFNYALFKRYLPIGVMTILGVFILSSSLLFWKNTALIKENRRLVKEYVSIIEKRSVIQGTLEKEDQRSALLAQQLDEIQKARTSLEKQLAHAERDYAGIVNVKETESVQAAKDKIDLLKKELNRVNKEADSLKAKEQERYASTLALQSKATILSLEQLQFSQKIIDGLSAWIKNRQDLVRGLVISFEGDRNLEKICYTYDQALAAIVFCITDNRIAAERIFNFYLRRVNRGEEIYNAYYSSGEAAEYTVHSGPNAWIGLAVLDYTKKTGDRKFLPIAQKVATMLDAIMDSEGGIKGGPNDGW
ncbi:MAG: PilZ domain-containing protein, partial [Candidatus Omnitrophica bacterium]|nr:PilZ domain-containing protein [Candidatus Omnitrophota bacterium]